jgi:glycine/D-amino acid oxidase-like deaminating enzyme
MCAALSSLSPIASPDQSFDVLVIGSGAVGLTVADQLVKASCQVGLISPPGTTGVASHAAGAMIDTFGELDQIESDYDRQKLDLKLKAQHLYPQWLEEISDRTGLPIFHRFGLFVVGNGVGITDRTKLDLIQSQLQTHHVAWESVDPQDIPGFAPDSQFPAHTALFLPDALTVDMAQFLPALETAIHNTGRYTRILEQVITLHQAGSTWQVQTASGQKFCSENLVVCAGAYTINLLGESHRCQAQLPPLYFGQGSSFTLNHGPAMPHGIRTPNRSGASSIHVVPRSHNRLYVGANNRFGTDLQQPQGAFIQDLQDLFTAVTHQINTQFSRGAIDKITWGLRPITPNDRPWVGATQLPGLFVVTGTHRTGIHLAPMLAQLLCQDLLGTPRILSNPFACENTTI